MNNNFFQFGYTQILSQRFHTLRQKARFIDDYTKEFYQFMGQNDLMELEDHMVAWYLGGLW